MFFLFSVIMLLVGLFNKNDTMILTSGLFAIAYSIEYLAYKYFNKK